MNPDLECASKLAGSGRKFFLLYWKNVLTSFLIDSFCRSFGQIFPWKYGKKNEFFWLRVIVEALFLNTSIWCSLLSSLSNSNECKRMNSFGVSSKVLFSPKKFFAHFKDKLRLYSWTVLYGCVWPFSVPRPLDTLKCRIPA